MRPLKSHNYIAMFPHNIVLECIASAGRAFVNMFSCFAIIGRKVAIDASMSIYQFLIAVTRAEGAGLTDSDGEVTR